MIALDRFVHEDGRECIRIGHSLLWLYDGGSERGDVCKRMHGKGEAVTVKGSAA